MRSDDDTWGYGAGIGSGIGSGCGEGDGLGYGDGDGLGDGNGDGNGSGSGRGSGDGDGNSSGQGWGDGTSTSNGFGNGSGWGYGWGDGSGDGCGFSSGDGWDDDILRAAMREEKVMDEKTGYESAAVLANRGMWDEINEENPPMVEDGGLIWRGAGWCENPVALAQAALDEIIRLTRERDEARRQVVALTEGLRLVSDALDRLNQIYRADADLGDPPVETPAWLQEAQHRAAALLTPTTPAPETCRAERCHCQ